MIVKGYKFQVELHIHKVSLAIAFQCKLQVIWKRGTQKIESIKQADLIKNQAIFDETMSLQSDVYLDNNNQFMEKKSQMVVILITEKGNKTAGQCNFDIAQYLNQKQETVQETLKLEKCPDKKATCDITLNFKMLREIDTDAMSTATAKTVNESFDVKQDTLQVSDSKNTSVLEHSPQIQNNEHKRVIEELSRNNDLKVHEINKYMHNLEELKITSGKEIDRLNTLLAEQVSQEQSLKQQLTALQSNIKSQSIEYETLKANLQTKSDENAKLVQQISNLKDQVEAIQHQLQASRELETQQLSQVKQDILKQQNLLVDKDQTISKLQEQLNTIQNELKQQQNKHMEQLQQHEQQQHELQKQQHDVEQQQQLQQQQNKINELSQLIDKLQQDANTVSEQHQIQLNTQITQLNEEHKQEIQNQIQLLNDKFKQDSAEKDKLISELKQTITHLKNNAKEKLDKSKLELQKQQSNQQQVNSKESEDMLETITSLKSSLVSVKQQLEQSKADLTTQQEVHLKKCTEKDKIITELKQSIVITKHQADSLKDEYDKLKEDKQQMQQELTGKDNAITRLQDELFQIKFDYDATKADKATKADIAYLQQQNQAKLMDKDRTIGQLNEAIAMMKNNATSLKGQLLNYKTSSEQHGQQKEQYVSRIAALEKQLKETSGLLVIKEQKATQLEEALGIANSNLKSLKQQLDNQQLVIDEMQPDPNDVDEQLKLELENEKKSHQQSLIEYQGRIKQLEQQINTLNNNNYESQQSKYAKQISDLEETIVQFKSSQNALNQQIQNKQSENKKLQEQLVDSQSEQQKLSMESSFYQNKLQQTEQKLQNAEDILEQHRNSLTSLKIQYENAQSTIKQLEEEQYLKQEITQLKDEVEQLKLQLEISQKALKDYTNEVGVLQRQVQDISTDSQISLLEEQDDTQQQQRMDIQDQLQLLKSAIARKLNEYQQTKQLLVAQLNKLNGQEQEDHWIEEIEILKRSVVQKQTENKEVTKQYTDEIKKIQQSTEQMRQQLESRIDKLQETIGEQASVISELTEKNKQNETASDELQQQNVQQDSIKNNLANLQIQFDTIKENSQKEIQVIHFNYKSQLEDLSQQIAQYKEQIQQLQQQQTKYKAEMDELLQQDSEQKDLIKFLERIRDNLEKKDEESLQYISQVENRNENLIIQAEQEQKQQELIKQQLQQSQDELTKCRQDIAKLHEVQIDIEQKLQQTENEKISISKQYQAALQSELQNSMTTVEKYEQQYEQQIKEQGQMIEQLQEQVFNLKCQMGDIFNIAMDVGGPKLVDQLQNAIGIREQ